MKLKRIFAAAFSAVLALSVSVSAAATEISPSDDSYLAGKAGRTETAIPYAGMNYVGGEQGDTSNYGYLIGKKDRAETAAPYAGVNYMGGEQGDTSGYHYFAGQDSKPWSTAK